MTADAPSPTAFASACHEWEAATEWRQVDFISDLHLCPELPKTFAAWRRWMLESSADAIVILGDLFEIWVGDDARSRPFERECVDVISEAACRRQVAFMPGNRDFLLGRAMLSSCGMTGLPDPTVLAAWGQRLLLTHGDALCLADLPYQAFRAQVRQPAWQREFLDRPLTERLAIARSLRQESQQRRAFDGDAGVDVDIAAAVAAMHAFGATTLVHGHTHRPGSDLLAPGFKRHVLSDWDLDDADAPRAEVLRLDRNGLSRLRVASA